MRPLAQNPAQAEAPKFVAIARFRFMPDMLLAKGLLESAGIEAAYRDENTIRHWYWINPLGAYELSVTNEHRDAARQLIRGQFGANLL